MLRHLIHKELRLSTHPALLSFLLLPALVLLPQWLYYIAFIYVYILIMIIAQTDKANNDLIFTALLPVRKRDIVTARTCVIVGWELAYIVVAAVCTVVRLWFYPMDNTVSMNANLAFYGTAFLMYAIFNAIYVPGSYKRPYRMLWPLLGGSLISLVFTAAVNTVVVAVPAVAGLFNDRTWGHLPYQLAAFVVGLAAFAGATLWANKKAAANLEMVDL